MVDDFIKQLALKLLYHILIHKLFLIAAFIKVPSLGSNLAKLWKESTIS